MFAIEKNVEIPAISKKSKYPFEEMATGDSFIIPTEKRNSVMTAYGIYSKRNSGVKFAVRKLKDGTCRVWRTL